MPEALPQNPPTEDLDQRVEMLLKQMERAAKQAAGIALELEAAPPALATEATEPPADANADLAAQVDQLLAQTEPGAPGGTPVPESIGSLDDELAKLASDLIQGDIDGEAEGSLPFAPVRPEPKVALPPDPTIGDPPVAHRQPRAMPTDPVVAPAPARAPRWRPAVARVVAGFLATLWSILHAILQHTPTLLEFLEPIAFWLAEAVSRPLRHRPALVRDAVGWVGLGTMFWATCLIAYFLFIFQPAPPQPSSTAVGLHGQAHEHEDEGHGSGDNEPADKAEPDAGKAEEKKAEAGHGAKPAAPAKSALKRSDKDPLNRPAPKEPAKPAAAGGH
jgi:hypothetical protein